MVLPLQVTRLPIRSHLGDRNTLHHQCRLPPTALGKASWNGFVGSDRGPVLTRDEIPTRCNSIEEIDMRGQAKCLRRSTSWLFAQFTYFSAMRSPIPWQSVGGRVNGIPQPLSKRTPSSATDGKCGSLSQSFQSASFGDPGLMRAQWFTGHDDGCARAFCSRDCLSPL